MRGALYVIGAVATGDPLDPVAASLSELKGAFSGVHSVGPGREISLRAFRRSFQPRDDRALYDLTALGDHGWVISALRELPAAVLVGARSSVAPVAPLSDMRAALRYAHLGFRLPAVAAIGGLDAAPPGANVDVALQRPAVALAAEAPVADAAIMIAPGAIETAYAVLAALRTASPRLSLIAETERDARDIRDIAASLNLDRAWVVFAQSRTEIAEAVKGAAALIDIARQPGAGLSDAGFVARCLGATVLDLSNPTAATEAVNLITMPHSHDPARAKSFSNQRRPEDFATSLIELTDLGARRARTAETAA
ncbi:MAG: hypothetical protein AAF401_13865 [Pseudomonadota bacterium]